MYDELVAKYGLVDGVVGVNSDKDNVLVTIDEEAAYIRTLQSNGWQRLNIYHKDGTEEELYER